MKFTVHYNQRKQGSAILQTCVICTEILLFTDTITCYIVFKAIE